MDNKQEVIHDKGFNMTGDRLNYGKIKVGVKQLDDATLNLSSIKDVDKYLGDKRLILKALSEADPIMQRKISNYFYRTSGIYARVCEYFAKMYRYDWYVAAEVFNKEKVKEDQVVKEFHRILKYLDNSYIKNLCGDIALKVIRDGAYYGYIAPSASGLILQELPLAYCRSYYNVGHLPAVEFNMRFFDDMFPTVEYRMRVLKMFPAEFQKGYVLYKQNKLNDITPRQRGTAINSSGWYLLTPGSVVKFSFNNGDLPLFVNACPAILDLDEAQGLDRRKQMQKLLKIIIQKLPLDKNGDLIFDVDEAADIHNNAVAMLRRAIGVDVLTTFTDVDSIDMSDKNTATTTDDLMKVERTVYNTFGVPSSLFNTDSNMALEKSILNDESYMRTLLLQFNIFFNYVVSNLGNWNKKNFDFSFYMLETTQYNYKEMSKLYKEQVQIGYSKMLPQIALGHSQSMILNTIYFENEILHLSELMIPPLMSSTLNGEDILGTKSKSNSSNSQTSTDNKGGRPEKPDDQKSDKTIKNKEAMNS